MSKNSLQIVLLGMVFACIPYAATAQQYFDPGLMQKSIESKPEDFQPPGARLGSFVFRPGVELLYASNDNIFYEENGEISDSIWHLRPWASLNSDWNRHSFNLSGWGDIARYSDYGSEDYEDWALRADGRVDVRHDSWLSFEASQMELHEDRRSPDNQLGIEPTEFTYAGYGAGYDQVFNRLKAGVYFRRNTFDYDDNLDDDGEIIDNQDRGRDEDLLTFRADYQVQPQRSLFASWALNEVDYDLTPDRNDFDRNADGHVLNAGVEWDITGVLSGDLFLSWSSRDYDDPRFADVDGFGLGGGLDWTPTPKTLVNLRFAGAPQETTQPGSSGYFSRLYAVRVQHELQRNWLAHARVSYTTNDYETNDSPTALADTEVTRAGVGLSYLVNRNFYLSAGYEFEEQDASIGSYEYEANRWFITLGAEF